MEKEITELQNLIRNGSTDKAYLLALKLYDKNKKNTLLIKILAYLSIQKEKFYFVIQILEEHYREKPENMDFDYYANMGYCLKSIEDYEKSIKMYDKAKDINKESPLCYMGPAEIFLKLRKFDESLIMINNALEKIALLEPPNISQFEQAIKLKTDINLALNKDEENGIFLKEILDKSFSPNLLYVLANINSKYIDSDLLKKTEDQLKTNETAFKSKLDKFWFVQPLYFGLAIYYQNKNQKISEQYYHKGNQETMKSLRYNSFDYQNHVFKTMNIYLNFKNKKISCKNEGENNFFILGTPRSGTTLIESLIASNDEVISGGELLSGYKMMGEFISNEEDLSTLQDKFNDIYLKRTDYIRGSYKYIVDKLPENFLYLGFYLQALPKSKIIRTFRNPWDVAISLYKQRYVTNIPYSASFFNIAIFMANYEALNIFWDQQINLDTRKRVFDIKYEDLVENPDYYQNKIYDFLELSSNYDENKRKLFFSQTASIRQVGSSIHKKSVEKNEFIENKADFFETLKMQRKYWEKKGISYENRSFFGYEI